MKREELVDYLDGLLVPGKFRDYCPNGLQVEGRAEVTRIVAGVTASQDLLDAAVALHADAILVHHGYFWKGEDGRVTGIRRQRLKTLLANDINLFAYHLPLDAHPELGNNAQLGQQLGLKASRCFGEQDLGFLGGRIDGGSFSSTLELAEHIKNRLNRPVVQVGPTQGAIKSIAWCSGGAQSYFEAAIAAGADAFITGEISEPQAHYAREMGVAFIACGHHASERYGAPAVAAQIAAQFGLTHQFIDIDNPA